MSIRDDARQEAERRYPIRLPYNRDFEIRAREQEAFEAGAVWASEQPDWEPSEDQGPAAGCAYCVGAGGYEDHDGSWVECSCQQADREPTPEEEREELANLIPLGFEARDGVRNVLEAADRILAAGFRKTDREPSADHSSSVNVSERAVTVSDAEVLEAARAILREMRNDNDFDPEYDYWEDAMRYAHAALLAAQEVRRNG